MSWGGTDDDITVRFDDSFHFMTDAAVTAYNGGTGPYAGVLDTTGTSIADVYGSRDALTVSLQMGAIAPNDLTLELDAMALAGDTIVQHSHLHDWYTGDRQTGSSLSGLVRLTQYENLREGDGTEALRLTSTAHQLFSVAQSVRSAVLFSLSCVDNAPDAGPVENIDSCVSFTLSVSATAAFDSMAFLRVTAARFMMNALSTTKRPAAEAFGVTALPGDALLQISAIYALR